MKSNHLLIVVLFMFTYLFQLHSQEKNNAIYVSMDEITPGQLRISSKRVAEKRVAAQQRGGLNFDDGKSFLDAAKKDDVLPVIKSPFGYVLADGHHEMMACRELKARTIPIKIIDDLSHTGNDFWHQAYAKGYVYPFDINGVYKIPSTFDQMQDDPNRYFATIIARKCNHLNQLNALSRGAEYPVWIKVGKDIHFIEFMISDALSQRGIHYDYQMGDNPPVAFIEKARQALIDAVNQAAKENSPLKNLKLIKERKRFDKI